jgi:phenylacetate-CoA ligase
MPNSFDGFRRTAQHAFFSALDDHVDRLTWDRQRIVDTQQQRCRTLLAHAAANSPFHARRIAAAGIDPAELELSHLQRLPIMTKAELMAEFDQVVTDPRETLAAAERALSETTTEPSPIDDAFVVLASGGSSGQRGVFVLDTAAMAEFGCLLLRSMMARLRATGGPPPGGLTIGIVAAGSAVHATGAGPRMLDGSPLRYVSVPVTLPIETAGPRTFDESSPSEPVADPDDE